MAWNYLPSWGEKSTKLKLSLDHENVLWLLFDLLGVIPFPVEPFIIWTGNLLLSRQPFNEREHKTGTKRAPKREEIRPTVWNGTDRQATVKEQGGGKRSEKRERKTFFSPREKKRPVVRSLSSDFSRRRESRHLNRWNDLAGLKWVVGWPRHSCHWSKQWGWREWSGWKWRGHEMEMIEA